MSTDDGRSSVTAVSGLHDAVVSEARDRVRGVFTHSGLSYPITVDPKSWSVTRERPRNVHDSSRVLVRDEGGPDLDDGNACEEDRQPHEPPCQIHHCGVESLRLDVRRLDGLA